MERRNNILAVFSFVIVLFLTIFFQPNFTYAVVIEEMKPDYGKDRDAAIEHGQASHNELTDRLNDSEMRTLSEVMESDFKWMKGFNTLLENKVRKESDLGVVEKEFIEDLDKVFLKAPKTSQVQYVYIPLKEEMFGMKQDYIYQEAKYKDRLDLEKYEMLKDVFRLGDLNGYSLGHLNSNEYQAQHFLYVRLRIPANEKILYTGENTIMLDRDKAFVIDQNGWRRTTNDKNKEIICVEARLVDKSYIQDHINERRKELNEQIAKRLNFPMDTEIVNFHEIKSLKSGIAMEQAEQLVNHYLNDLPEEVVKRVFLPINKNGEFSLNFYDKTLEKFPGAIAFFDPQKVSIEFDISKSLKADGFTRTFSRIGMHEFGHAVDYIILSDNSNYYWTQHDSEMLSLYKTEQNFVTEEFSYDLYAKKNVYEYFAEIFSAMHSDSEELKVLAMELVPNSARYIMQKVLEAATKIEP